MSNKKTMYVITSRDDMWLWGDNGETTGLTNAKLYQTDFAAGTAIKSSLVDYSFWKVVPVTVIIELNKE